MHERISMIAPYRSSADAVLSDLGSDAAHGLSRAEVERRLTEYGPNQLKSAPETPWWRRLLEQFENFLVIILLVAIVISMVEWLLQDPRETALPYEAIVILAIVVLNAMLGFVQEARAEKSVRALMALAAPEATVIRDGERQRIATHDIVPGDIVLVEAGDKIPADARLIEVANLQTDEAPLTGESMPVAKDARPIDGDVGLGDRRNMLYSGTVATYGRGRAVVVATGMETEVGRIAGLLEAAEKEPTPLQQELDRTGKRLSVIMLGICAVVFATGLLSSHGHHPQRRARPVPVRRGAGGRRDPGGAAGDRDGRAEPRRAPHGGGQRHRAQAAGGRDARRRDRDLLRQDRHADAQRDDGARDRSPSSALIEVGGSGYIPEGEFTVDGEPLAAGSPHARRASAQTLRAAALANDADAGQQRGPLARAGRPDRRRADRRRAQVRHRRSRARALPAHRRNPVHVRAQAPHHRPSSTATTPAELRVFVKGAPEMLLAKCRYLWDGGKIVPLERRAPRRPRCSATRSSPRQALRTLAIATRTVPAAALGIDPQAQPPADQTSSCRRASRTISCCSASSA